MQLSFEEALAFASLISAVDPVATLAVFEHLRVDSFLHSMVYGEAVLNDAVAVVLFRMFTSFMTREATGNAIGEQIGMFVLVFVASVLIGVGFGLLATSVFWCVRVYGGGYLTEDPSRRGVDE